MAASVGRYIYVIRCVSTSSVDFLTPMWPLTPGRLNRLNRLQTHFLAKAMGHKPRCSEVPSVYFQRIHLDANRMAKVIGQWAGRWQTAQTRWYEHVQRHPESFLNKLINRRSDEWLSARRRENASGKNTSLAGRIRSRVIVERVQPRWHSAIRSVIPISPSDTKACHPSVC